MRKRVGVELDTEDPLDAQFLVDFVGVRNRGKWLRGCLLLGYLVATGKLEVKEDESAEPAADAPPEAEPERRTAPGKTAKGGKGGGNKGNGVGNSLFGIK